MEWLLGTPILLFCLPLGVSACRLARGRKSRPPCDPARKESVTPCILYCCCTVRIAGIGIIDGGIDVPQKQVARRQAEAAITVSIVVI